MTPGDKIKLYKTYSYHRKKIGHARSPRSPRQRCLLPVLVRSVSSASMPELPVSLTRSESSPISRIEAVCAYKLYCHLTKNRRRLPSLNHAGSRAKLQSVLEKMRLRLNKTSKDRLGRISKSLQSPIALDTDTVPSLAAFFRALFGDISDDQMQWACNIAVTCAAKKQSASIPVDAKSELSESDVSVMSLATSVTPSIDVLVSNGVIERICVDRFGEEFGCSYPTDTDKDFVNRFTDTNADALAAYDRLEKECAMQTEIVFQERNEAENLEAMASQDRQPSKSTTGGAARSLAHDRQLRTPKRKKPKEDTADDNYRFLHRTVPKSDADIRRFKDHARLQKLALRGFLRTRSSDEIYQNSSEFSTYGHAYRCAHDEGFNDFMLQLKAGNALGKTTTTVKCLQEHLQRSWQVEREENQRRKSLGIMINRVRHNPKSKVPTEEANPGTSHQISSVKPTKHAHVVNEETQG